MRPASLILVSFLAAICLAQKQPAAPYSDTKMKAIYDKFVVDRKDGLLSVVPNGKTKPLTWIFSQLGLDPRRLGKPTAMPADWITYYTWQVSPGYQLSIMVAVLEDRSRGSGGLLSSPGY